MTRIFPCFLLFSAAVIFTGCKPGTASREKSSTATLTVAAASDLKFALDELAGEYRAAHPSTAVNITYGSSGNFFNQIQNQAPFDLYFSADIEYPRKLAGAGLALDNDVFRYAIGHLAVWISESSALDVEHLGIAALADPSVKKVAIANPKHAPYGRAAIAALKFLGVFDTVEPKLIYGENIMQTAQFVQSGAADAGILALSLAMAPQMKDAGRYWRIPPEACPGLEQGGMILNSTGHEMPRAVSGITSWMNVAALC